VKAILISGLMCLSTTATAMPEFSRPISPESDLIKQQEGEVERFEWTDEFTGRAFEVIIAPRGLNFFEALNYCYERPEWKPLSCETADVADGLLRRLLRSEQGQRIPVLSYNNRNLRGGWCDVWSFRLMPHSASIRGMDVNTFGVSKELVDHSSRYTAICEYTEDPAYREPRVLGPWVCRGYETFSHSTGGEWTESTVGNAGAGAYEEKALEHYKHLAKDYEAFLKRNYGSAFWHDFASEPSCQHVSEVD